MAVAAICAALFLVLLALVEAAWSPLLRADRAVENSLDRFAVGHRALVDIARIVSAVGQPVVLEVIVGLLVAVEFHRRRRRAAWALLAALLSEMTLGHFVKVLVGRKRPRVTAPVAHAVGASFPSSHAVASATLVTACLLLVCVPVDRIGRRVVGSLGVAAIVLIGLSRLFLTVHYPTDVAAGWLLGLALGFGAAAGAISPAHTGADPPPDAKTSPRQS